MDLGRHLGGEGSLYKETRLFLAKHSNAPTEEELRVCPFPLYLMTTVWYPFPAGHRLWLPLGNSSAPCCLVQAKTVEVLGLKRDLRGACILMTYIDRITGGSLGSPRIEVTFLLPFISSGTGS